MRRSVVEVIDNNSQVLLAKPQNLLDENVYSFDFDLSDPDSGFLQLTLQPPAHLCLSPTKDSEKSFGFKYVEVFYFGRPFLGRIDVNSSS